MRSKAELLLQHPDHRQQLVKLSLLCKEAFQAWLCLCSLHSREGSSSGASCSWQEALKLQLPPDQQHSKCFSSSLRTSCWRSRWCPPGATLLHTSVERQSLHLLFSECFLLNLFFQSPQGLRITPWLDFLLLWSRHGARWATFCGHAPCSF